MKIHQFLKRSIIPLTLGGVFVLLSILESVGIGVHPNEIVSLIGQRPVAVALVAIAENVSLINMWFPGSILILGAMASTAGNPSLAITVFTAIVAGSVVGQHANYLIGRVATRRSRNKTVEARYERMRSKASARGWWVLFVAAMWHPQSASVVSLFAGAEGLRYSEYAPRMLGAGLCWSVVWGVVLYTGGHSIDIASHFDIIVIIYVSAWLAYNAWSVGRQVSKDDRELLGSPSDSRRTNESQRLKR